MSEPHSTPSSDQGSFSATLLAAIGCFVIFLVILLVAYVPNRAPAVGNGVKTPAERKAALAELRGKEQTTVSSYGWVDKEKGVVRLPLDRAIELTIQEHVK